MSSIKNFEKRVISFNDNEYQNRLRGFKIESQKVNDYWLSLNSKLCSIYKLSDVISFIENPSILKDVFDKENKSEAVAKAKANGISVEALSGLDSIPLTQKQQGILNELQKIGQYSMFKNGLSSKDWLIDGEVQVTEKVESEFEKQATLFTKAPIANNRLKVLEAFEQHLEKFPEDRATMLQILRHGNGRQFVNYGL